MATGSNWAPWTHARELDHVYLISGQPPKYDYDSEPDGMRRADGQGFKISGSMRVEFWPTNGYLMRALIPDDKLRRVGRYPTWADHQRIERTIGEPTVYVCHPYRVGAEAFQDFIRLQAAGWQVDVWGRSVYYPGATVRVEISKANR